ncbi:hypothetical protein DY926_16435 [Komagataeibacter melaceti]|uniref:Uncharacterized protein n=1 Tax=Komagataeibacter melaceti TaxID=2766577 RepID=A0A371YW56_9PROT|nr:hypothetical protein DY926_16435 [Komagataeibacter melaceti]
MLPSEGSIGIFWLVSEKGNSRFLLDRRPLSQGETYGNAMTWGGHYEFWEQIRSGCMKECSAVPQWSEYEEWPRGRVVYNIRENIFIVYADRKLLTDEMKREIRKAFSLPTLNTRYSPDNHYISIRSVMLPQLNGT